MKQQRAGSAVRVAQPLRTLAQRFTFILLIAAAIGVMLAGRTDPRIFEDARVAVTDAVAPILSTVSQPINAVEKLTGNLLALKDVHQENQRLRLENERLLQWQAVARQLEIENRQLQSLLSFRRPDVERFVTARVIGLGGTFVRTVVISAGREQGVRKGQVAVTGDGLIGRVSDVGDRSARVLLLTDLNSRIPVLAERTRSRGILVGNNTSAPRLEYLSANSGVRPGDRIVTSGDGGAFPPGIPVGTVSTLDAQGLQVQPYATAAKLEFLRLMDFGLRGILAEEPTAR